jgi:hypothetical protein
MVFVPIMLASTTARRYATDLRIDGYIDIYFHGNKIVKPTKGVAGWMANNIGILSKVIEKYNHIEFVENINKFLSNIQLKNILTIEMDYEEIYGDSDNKDPDDLDKAIEEITQWLETNKGNKLLISAVRQTGDFTLTIEIQYQQKHGENKAPLEIKIIGIPSIFGKQYNEDDDVYEKRMEQLEDSLDDEIKYNEFVKQHQMKMQIIIDQYKTYIEELFDVKNIIAEVAEF